MSKEYTKGLGKRMTLVIPSKVWQALAKKVKMGDRTAFIIDAVKKKLGE